MSVSIATPAPTIQLSSGPSASANPVLNFGNAQDPLTGVLCPDYPLAYRGPTSGDLYPSIHAAVMVSVAGKYNSTYDETRKLIDNSVLMTPEGTIDWNAVNSMHQGMWIASTPKDISSLDLYNVDRAHMVCRAVICRYMQNEDALKVLLATAGKDLHYINPDQFFGTGSTEPGVMNGQNAVGVYSMEFRDAIIAGRKQEFTWGLCNLPGPSGISSFPRKEISKPTFEAPGVVEAPAPVVIEAPVAPVVEVAPTPAPVVVEEPVAAVVEEVVAPVKVAPAPVVVEAPVVEVAPTPAPAVVEQANADAFEDFEV